MKKHIIMLLIAAFFMPGICQGFNSDVKAGDIILLESESFSLGGYELWIPLFKSICGIEHLPAHAEVVVDDEGKTFSSIQPNGTTYSTVGQRLKQFGKGILLRNSTLTDEQITAVVETAIGIDAPYEYLKYDLLALSFMWDIVFCNCCDETRTLVEIFENPDALVCSEITTLVFELNNIKASVKPARLSSPLDILKVVNVSDWEIVEIWEE